MFPSFVLPVKEGLYAPIDTSVESDPIIDDIAGDGVGDGVVRDLGVVPNIDVDGVVAGFEPYNPDLPTLAALGFGLVSSNIDNMSPDESLMLSV